MKRSLTESLKKMDQFGAIFKPSIYVHANEHKTPIGGLLSILLYGISLTYVIYEMVIWQRGDVLPKVTHLQRSYDLYSYKIPSMFHISSRNFKHTESIDPFNPTALILQPILYKVVDGVMQDPQSLTQFIKIGSESSTYQIEIPSLELTLNESNQSQTPNVDYLLTLQQCETQYLADNESCADVEISNKFWSQRMKQLLIKNFVQQYNTSTKQIERIKQEYCAAYDENTTFYSQIRVDSTELNVDDGFILEDWEVIKYVEHVEVYNQQMDLRYFGELFNRNVYLAFEIELGNVENIEFVEYPKISQILADVGAIVSFFLFFSQIAFIINERTLEQEAIRSVIEMYYPQLKNVQMVQNTFGQCTQIKYEDRNVQKEKYLDKMKELESIAKEKLCLSNMIYELSRLQFAMQSLVSTTDLRKMHNIGIRVDDFLIKMEQENEQVKDEKQENIMKTIQVDESIQQIIPQQVFDQSMLEVKEQKDNPLKSPQTISPSSIKQVKLIKNRQEGTTIQRYTSKILDDEDFGLLVKSNQDKKQLQLISEEEDDEINFYKLNYIVV